MKRLAVLALTALFFAQNSSILYAAESATVRSVRVSADSVYIDTDRPVQYKVFTMEQPPKLVLELMDAKMRTLQEIPVNSGAIRKVRTGQFKTSPVSISRIVMDLSKKTAYEITRKGTELIVMLGARPAAARTSVKDTPADTPAGVTVIAPDAKTAPAKPLEMTLEAAPIKAADTGRDSAPVISSARKSAGGSSRGILDSLPRDPITFDYSEADVREVLDMMAAKAGINMIYGDEVSGTITISLSKVPFDEAFRTILNVKGLAAQQAGDNILRIATPATFMAEQKKAIQQTRVFFLNYTTAATVKSQIDSVAAAEGRSKATCAVDDTNNAVIVTDTPQGLESTAILIRSLDRMPKQVLIEAKLVEVSLEDTFDMGVVWGASGGTSSLGGGNGSYYGTNVAINGVDRLGNTVKLAVPGSANVGTGVNLAPSTIYGGLRFGRIVGNERLDVTLQAAAKKGKAKVLSNPKVATLNNKAANIKITDQTHYDQQTVTTANGITTVAHAYTNVDTGITLTVTPTINSDGRIAMHVAPSVIQLAGTPDGVSPPQTATRSTDTNVIVKDGETIVIGGLIHDTQSETVYKVPVLGDIPLLGLLFRRKSTARTRVELLIFVTPKVIED
jgi:type IV pilus assembly protein PilQ